MYLQYRLVGLLKTLYNLALSKAAGTLHHFLTDIGSIAMTITTEYAQTLHIPQNYTDNKWCRVSLA